MERVGGANEAPKEYQRGLMIVHARILTVMVLMEATHEIM